MWKRNSLVIFVYCLFSCAEPNFRGGETGTGEKPNTPNAVVPPTPPLVTPDPRPLLPVIEKPACSSQEKISGAHFVFLVDNSGSMLETDCPERNGNRCQQSNREKAILATFDWLSELRSNASDPSTAESQLSVARFTPQDKGGRLDELAQTDFVSVSTKPENRDALVATLRFNRQPYGDTPLLNALLLAEQVASYASNRGINKDSVFVLLTDGEATDRSPAAVRELANKLKYPLFTIRINHLDIDPASRFAAHRNNMELNYPGWSTDDFESMDAYVNALMALPAAISSEALIEISSSQALQTTIFDDIIRKKLGCIEVPET